MRCRVMIRESGLEHDLPLTDEKKELILSQYAEYKLLEKRLGNAARMTIAPVVKYDSAEYKALEDLRTECKKVTNGYKAFKDFEVPAIK